MKPFILSIFLLSLFNVSLSATQLDENFELSELRGKNIGYYIGSFDPLHLGHQHAVETAIEEGHVDYVLIYPAPGGDSFKNRTSLEIRQQMIASVYQQNPKVLFTEWTPKELQDRFPLDVHVIGIIGSDVVTETFYGSDTALSEKYQKVFMRGLPLAEKHYLDTVGALMALRADSFLVALRGNVDLSHLNGMLYDRRILSFIQSETISSTAVRKAVQEKTAFEELVSPSVEEILIKFSLYQK